MYYLTYALVLAVLLLALLASIGARADDTYNFFFQKAPGAVAVNQGTSSPAATAAAPAMAASTAAVPAAEAAHHRLFLTLGYAAAQPYSQPTRFEMVTGQKDLDLTGGQYALRVELDLSDRFSTDIEVYKATREVGFRDGFGYIAADPQYSENVQRDPTLAPSSSRNILDFGVGGAWNFVRLRATTVSLLGGVQSVPSLHYQTVSGDRSAGVAFPDGTVHHWVRPYAGARVRLLVDDIWGLDLSYRALLGKGLGDANAGVTFAF